MEATRDRLSYELQAITEDPAIGIEVGRRSSLG